MKRKITREVKVGCLKVGGNNPVIIQSMCNTDTRDVMATVNQILQLEKAGCELIRVAVPDMVAAEAIKEIKKQIHIPLVADIHFDYRLALRVMELGIDKIRINPGILGRNLELNRWLKWQKKKPFLFALGSIVVH